VHVHTLAALTTSTRLCSASLLAAAAAATDGLSMILTVSPTSKWFTYKTQTRIQNNMLTNSIKYCLWTAQMC